MKTILFILLLLTCSWGDIYWNYGICRHQNVDEYFSLYYGVSGLKLIGIYHMAEIDFDMSISERDIGFQFPILFYWRMFCIGALGDLRVLDTDFIASESVFYGGGFIWGNIRRILIMYEPIEKAWFFSFTILKE